MSDNSLKIHEKNKLCEYKAANPKMTANQLIEFCVTEFKKRPSKAQISRTLSSEDTWKASRSDVNAKRARGGNWPDLEP
jgi:hypothetical protein